MRESPYYLHFYTLLCTGLRRGELLGLRWLNVDLELAQIYVTRSLDRLGNGAYIIKRPKTAKSRRAIDIPPSLCVLLRDHKAQQASQNPDDLVFGLMDPRTLSHAFHKMARRAGLELRLHDLRHLHAMLMLTQGIHPKIVQERLGHSSISMTLDAYSHVVPGLHKAAAQSFDTMIQRLQKNVAKMSPESHNIDITAG
jgi:integrase